jgi:intergrase/recombinase
MIKQGFDSRLVDFCLEHKQSDVIEHYLDLSYSSKKEVFQKYWNLIRN